MSYDEKVGAMASHPSNLDAAVERLVNSAVAELQGPSVDPVVCESTSLDVGIANDHPGGGELLDAVFFGDEGRSRACPRLLAPRVRAGGSSYTTCLIQRWLPGVRGAAVPKSD